MSGKLSELVTGQSSTAAKPCGTCPNCGGTLYEYLAHGCTTSIRQGSIHLTPWGTWEWRPW